MAKVDIYSGFLGAGKTTLIKKLIKEAYNDEKIVLIENEFGEIGIDGGFLKDAGIKVNEINSGCICCSLVGDFGQALNEVISTYDPDRIIIEPSGVGKLSDIIKAVNNVDNDKLELSSYTTIVDANKCKVYMKNFGEFFNNQIENAKCIILSHTGTSNEDKINECIKLIREKNKDANIISTNWDEISGEKIMETIYGSNGIKTELDTLAEEIDICPECGHHHDHEHDECECGHHHDHDHDECECGHHHGHDHHHHADEVFTSTGIETAKKFSKNEINDILKELEENESYGTILRAKGMVASENSWIYFDYVPGEIDIREGSADVIGKICVIGSKIDTEAINKLFN